jgi:hypothetical protein
MPEGSDRSDEREGVEDEGFGFAGGTERVLMPSHRHLAPILSAQRFVARAICGRVRTETAEISLTVTIAQRNRKT